MDNPDFVAMFAEALDDEMLIAQYRVYRERAAADTADIAADAIVQSLTSVLKDRGLSIPQED